MLPLNPFLYGKPVPPSRFIGRQDAIRTVFSRLKNGESTAIVGEPHIGKSSLLNYVADKKRRFEWLGEEAVRLFVTVTDCHMLSSNSTASDFWRQALADLPKAISDDAVVRQWDEVGASRFSPDKLKALLNLLARSGQRIMLAIDEFDVLLNHPHFKANTEFFGSLRSMATQTESLAVITASRLPVAVINRLSQALNPSGSPFFNYFTEVRLRPLLVDECRILIEKALTDSDVEFTDDDFTFIHTLAGCHPFLVQTAAAGVFDAAVEGKTGQARYLAASKLFQNWAAAHFDGYWRHLSSTEQIALVVLALGEMKGSVEGPRFHADDLAGLDRYSLQLKELLEAGMASQRDPNNSFAGVAAWNEAYWQAVSRGFVWWVIDNIVAGTRETIGFDRWLQEQETRNLLTREQVHKLRNLANAIPKAAVRNPLTMVEMLLGETLADGATGEFDVFLSYNSADRDAVKEIANRLKARGILPWLDEWELRPGLPWQKALQKQIKKIKAAAVFVGAKGIGPWQDMEQEAFIQQFVKRQCPVIPVILMGTKRVPKLPIFLNGMTWVDFRKEDPDPLERLVYGITGKRKSSP